jgi:methyl-accepting chemotaxis protein
MEEKITELQKEIEVLTIRNIELTAFKKEYSSTNQSLNRMSSRLRKLCKRLTPETETVLEMQKIADEIRDLIKK